jgi:hypothetical protein
MRRSVHKTYMRSIVTTLLRYSVAVTLKEINHGMVVYNMWNYCPLGICLPICGIVYP